MGFLYPWKPERAIVRAARAWKVAAIFVNGKLRRYSQSGRSIPPEWRAFEPAPAPKQETP